MIKFMRNYMKAQVSAARNYATAVKDISNGMDPRIAWNHVMHRFYQENRIWAHGTFSKANSIAKALAAGSSAATMVTGILVDAFKDEESTALYMNKSFPVSFAQGKN